VTPWLRALPHQIPFRAASSARRVDDANASGSFLCTAGDTLAAGGDPAPLMMVEAMAQVAGGLVFAEGEAGYLSAIDDTLLERAPEAGDALEIRVELEREFGGIFRFRGTLHSEGVEVGRARFCLARTGPNRDR
jgi:hypothetical protein